MQTVTSGRRSVGHGRYGIRTDHPFPTLRFPTAPHFTLNPKSTSFPDVRDDRSGRSSYIVIDPRQSFQPVDGFGFALTGGSAEMLMRMSPEARTATLRDVFDPVKGAGVSCVRLTVGASDLNRFVFFYDDMPEGQEDFKLEHFSLSQDLRDVIPVMNEILKINPDIYVLHLPGRLRRG